MDAGLANGAARSLALVAAKIVEDDDFGLGQRWSQCASVTMSDRWLSMRRVSLF